MINRFGKLFAGGWTSETVEDKTEELELASAALLIEAACMDGDFDDGERSSIAALLAAKFDLSEIETASLIAEAEQAVEETGNLYGFTRIIKDRYNPEERIGMIEMLWEVAVADGNIDMFESNLIRRVGGLIYVSDRDRGLAKQRVMARLGINDGSV
ncbi:MAG: TerB family tellurite resistance protein [Rhodospirillales bacterium]|nr:TerB family tellurite resistance protein [Rhodospirillales bacterium]